MADLWSPPMIDDDDVPLTFCDQCGHLQLGTPPACENCGVLLGRSVYDPFVTIHQNAAVVRQAIRGRAKPSAFGKSALIGLAFLYLAYSVVALRSLLVERFSILTLLFVILDLAIGVLILAAFHRMRTRDSWDEYLRWS